MSDSAQDYRRRSAEVLDGVEYGPKQVLAINDAEILALDDPDKPRVTPLLSLGPAVSEQQRNLAAGEAAKRLFATGRTADGTPLGGEESDAAEPTAHTVLRMRRSWLCLLTLDQHTALGRQFVSVYLRADRRAMTEVATPDGRHQFTVLKRAAALDAAAEILTPTPEASDEDGPGRAYPAETWKDDARDMLAAAKIASTVISRRQNRTMDRKADDRLAVYNFDDRTEVLFAEGDDRVRIAPISRRSLRRRLERITRPLDLELAENHDG